MHSLSPCVPEGVGVVVSGFVPLDSAWSGLILQLRKNLPQN